MYVIRAVLHCKPRKVRQMVDTLMATERLRRTMADYHELVENGRRGIYRIES
jgi:hypothetical protein